jgi:hypothetical protein
VDGGGVLAVQVAQPLHIVVENGHVTLSGVVPEENTGRGFAPACQRIR